MAHTIRLGSGLLIILLANALLFLIGPLGFLVLVFAAVLLWYAFGPGARPMVVTAQTEPGARASCRATVAEGLARPRPR